MALHSQCPGRDLLRVLSWNRNTRLVFQMIWSLETDRSIERLFDARPPGNLACLHEMKARSDPENVFRSKFDIAPRAQVA
jgi:hypothetical protein